jgi:hypothetical protein
MDAMQERHYTDFGKQLPVFVLAVIIHTKHYYGNIRQNNVTRVPTYVDAAPTAEEWRAITDRLTRAAR